MVKRPDRSTPTGKGLPSWSWLSVDSPVEYQFLSLDFPGCWITSLAPRWDSVGQPVATAEIVTSFDHSRSDHCTYAQVDVLRVRGRLLRASPAEVGHLRRRRRTYLKFPTAELGDMDREHCEGTFNVVWDCAEELLIAENSVVDQAEPPKYFAIPPLCDYMRGIDRCYLFR